MDSYEVSNGNGVRALHLSSCSKYI